MTDYLNMYGCNESLSGLEGRARELYEEGLAAFEKGEYPKAVDILVMCRDSAVETVQKAALEVIIGNCFVALGDFNSALEYYDSAITAAGDKKDPSVVFAGLFNRGAVERLRKNFEKAVSNYLRGLDLAGEAESGEEISACLNELSEIAAERDDTAEAEKCRRQAIETCINYGMNSVAAYHSMMLGSLYNQKERLDEAIESYSHARLLFEKEEHESGIAVCLDSMAGIHIERNEPEEALICCDAARDIFRRINVPDGEANVLFTRGVALQRSARFSEATETFRDAVDAFNSLGDNLSSGNCSYEMARTFLAGDMPDRAEESFTDAYRMYEKTGEKRLLADAAAGLGMACRAMGETRCAIEHFEECSKLYEELGADDALADVLQHFACVCYEAGEPDAALFHFTRARDIYLKIGDGEGARMTENNMSCIRSGEGEH